MCLHTNSRAFASWREKNARKGAKARFWGMELCQMKQSYLCKQNNHAAHGSGTSWAIQYTESKPEG